MPKYKRDTLFPVKTSIQVTLNGKASLCSFCWYMYQQDIFWKKKHFFKNFHFFKIKIVTVFYFVDVKGFLPHILTSSCQILKPGPVIVFKVPLISSEINWQDVQFSNFPHCYAYKSSQDNFNIKPWASQLNKSCVKKLWKMQTKVRG